MGAVKSKHKRERRLSTRRRSTRYSNPVHHNLNYNLVNTNVININPINTNHNVVHTNINDNLINIVNIINNLNNFNNANTVHQDNNNNNNNTNNQPDTRNDHNNATDVSVQIAKDTYGDDGLLLENSNIVIDEGDQLSRATTYVVWRILSLLTMRELCNVQQVSHFWYKAAKENEVWKRIVLRDSMSWEASSKGMVNTLKSSSLMVRWKRIAREECGHQQCWKCKKKFQKCKNSAIACMYHPQGRELIEDKIGAPSGVYWTCCLNRSKISPGCVIGYHSEYEWVKEKTRGGRGEGAMRDRVDGRGRDVGRRVSL